ncbi:hypothetical protein [Bradyrhizobium sp.]|uniref:hypothetical protein n=1 Tax=Bradyrhizobium sp. TaxID=376 RepID=UPI003C5DCF2A
MKRLFPILAVIIRRAILGASAVAFVSVSIPVVHAMPKAQETSGSINKKKQEKKKAAAEGKKKAAARKEITGRDHQGNHDSLTKKNANGAKGDRHMNGVTQSGAAGSRKKK